MNSSNPSATSPNKPYTQPDSQDPEISLLDILLFLKRAYKTIAVTTVFGLIVASMFLLLIPNQYEALANIAMGKVAPGGANIEEPQALINRMSLPTSLDSTTLQACDLQVVGEASNSANPQAPTAKQLTKVIKLAIPKGVANIVELKVIRPSVEAAKVCANSVFETIARSQAQIIEPIAQQTKAANGVRLAKVETRLAQDKSLLAKSGESKGAVTQTYFALLSEIRNLEDEREKLLATIDTSAVQTAILQSPVYVAEQPIYPKKAVSLLAGLFGGLFLGVLIALTRQTLPKFKAQLQGAV